MNKCKAKNLKSGMMATFQYGEEGNYVKVEITGSELTSDNETVVSFVLNNLVNTIKCNPEEEFEIEECKNKLDVASLSILVNETPAVIDDNFEEVRESLSEMMKTYEGLTYTDDTVADARKDVATLRKIRKALDDKRKEVKKAHMIPYEEFEAKAKELCEIIDNAINPINNQIDKYAERKKAEKKAKIQEYFSEQIGDIDCLTFEDVFNPTWISNMATAMKSIKTEIDERISTVKQDIETIKAFGSEIEEKALSTYKLSKKLSDAINIINDYEKQKAAILAREEEKRKAEEERKRQEEIRRKQEEESKIREAEEARIREEERKKQEEIERIREEEREKARKEFEEKVACDYSNTIQEENVEQVDQEQHIVTPFMDIARDNAPCNTTNNCFTVFRINASAFEISMIEDFLTDNEIVYTKM